MRLKNLAETVILQSIEDLFTTDHADESIRFFDGEGFGLAADIAALGVEEKQKIMDMVTRISSRHPHQVARPSGHRTVAGAAI